jgi:hypothetical protein
MSRREVVDRLVLGLRRGQSMGRMFAVFWAANMFRAVSRRYNILAYFRDVARVTRPEKLHVIFAPSASR